MNHKFSAHNVNSSHFKRICQIYEMADLGATKKLLTILFRMDRATRIAIKLEKSKYRSGPSWVSSGGAKRLHANIIYYYYCNCSPENIDFHRRVNISELIAVSRIYKINFNNELADINRIHSLFEALFLGEIVTDVCNRCGLVHIYYDTNTTHNYSSCPFCLSGSKANCTRKFFNAFYS